MTVEQIINLVQVGGVSLVILLAMLWGLYRLGRLLIDKAVIPLAQAHIDNLQSNTERLAKIQHTLPAVCRFTGCPYDKEAKDGHG